MIITKLNGGLGNQMFEYAHARSIQIDNNDDLYLDIEGFSHWNPKYPRRFYSLRNFHLCNDVKILDQRKCKKLLFWQFLSKINRRFASRLSVFFHIYLWKNPNMYKVHIENTKKYKNYFYGYWQSERYFYKHRDAIVKELMVKTPIPLECEKYILEAQKSNSVCVHIRRGDYVTGGMIFCDAEYYIRGMQYIKNIHNDARFLVFTDDIEWVKNNIQFIYSVTIVDINVPDYEILRIMYTCNHFVISNSSFSWWAQYLSSYKEKIVVAPNRWFPTKDYDNSIYQKNWIIIGSDYE